MNDWAVGDLAVCVSDAPRFNAFGVFEGRIYRVVGIVVARPGMVDAGQTGLNFENINITGSERIGWNARLFRKVPPDEREACEPEFVTLLQRIKRKVVA